jgi:hypothetical protein
MPLGTSGRMGFPKSRIPLGTPYLEPRSSTGDGPTRPDACFRPVLASTNLSVPLGTPALPVHSRENSPLRCPSPRSCHHPGFGSGVNVTRPFNNDETIGRAFVGSSASTRRQSSAIVRSSSRTRLASEAFRRPAERSEARSASRSVRFFSRPLRASRRPSSCPPVAMAFDRRFQSRERTWP